MNDVTIGTFFFSSIFFLLLSVLVTDRKLSVTPLSICVGVLLFMVPIKFFFMFLNNIEMSILFDKDYLYYSGSAIAIFSFVVFLVLFALSMKDLRISLVGFEASKFIFAFSFVCFFASCSLVILRHGLSVLSQPILFREGLESSGALYLTQLYILVVNLSMINIRSRARMLRIIFYVTHFGFCFLAGRPGYLLIYLLNIIFLSTIEERKKLVNGLVLTLGFLPMLAVFLLKYRLVKSNNFSVIEASSIVINDLGGDDFREILSLIFLRSDQLEHFSNFLGFIVDQRLSPSFQSIWYSIVQFIPRGIMPDKPYTFSSEMTGFFYPEVLSVGVTNNFLGIAEFIYYFGLSGVLLSGVYFGIFAKMLSIYFQASFFDRRVYYVAFNIIFLYIFNGITSGFFNEWAFQCLILNLFYMSFLGKWVLFKRT